MYIAPGQGQTTAMGQSCDVHRKALSLYPFVASFCLVSDFHDLIHVYSPGAGGIQPPPPGQSFDVNRNFFSLQLSVASFKS